MSFSNKTQNEMQFFCVYFCVTDPLQPKKEMTAANSALHQKRASLCFHAVWRQSEAMARVCEICGLFAALGFFSLTKR